MVLNSGFPESKACIDSSWKDYGQLNMWMIQLFRIREAELSRVLLFFSLLKKWRSSADTRSIFFILEKGKRPILNCIIRRSFISVQVQFGIYLFYQLHSSGYSTWPWLTHPQELFKCRLHAMHSSVGCRDTERWSFLSSRTFPIRGHVSHSGSKFLMQCVVWNIMNFKFVPL